MDPIADVSYLSKVLLFDNDVKLLETLVERQGDIPHEFLIVRSEPYARGIIEDPEKYPLEAAFFNVGLCTLQGLPLLKSIKQQRPGLPVFAILNAKTDYIMSHRDLISLGVTELLKSPLVFEELASCLSRVVTNKLPFDKKSGIYLPLKAQEILIDSEAMFDLFVRLASNRYVQILKLGDVLTRERWESFVAKGVTHFYIRIDPETQKAQIRHADLLTEKLLSSPNAPPRLKISQTLGQGQETWNFLRSQGLNAETLEYASSFANRVGELVEKIDFKDAEVIWEYLNDLQSQEHALSTTLIAGILSKDFELEISRPLETVGLASFLHDIGLSDLPEVLLKEEPAILTPEQLTLYHSHPQRGADLLKRIPVIPKIVSTIVANHHPEFLAQGTTRKTVMGETGRIAEIIGLASHLAQLIHKHAQDSTFDIRKQLEISVLPLYSKQVAYRFRSLFIENNQRRRL